MIVKGTQALVPKGALVRQVMYALCTHVYDDGREVCELEDVGDYWACPREIYTDEQCHKMNLDVLRLQPTYRTAFAGTKPVGPEGAQSERQQRLQTQALAILISCRGGVVELPPGTGKTALAFALMQHYKVPTLVVVHTKNLQVQWAERAQSLMGLERDRIGFIGGGKKKKDYTDKDLVIALVQSLTSKKGQATDWMGQFGLAIYDEVHHMQAARFRLALNISAGVRVGLSATVKNRGLENVFLQHLGPVVYRSQETDLQPEIVLVDVQMHPRAADVRRIERGRTLDDARGTSIYERSWTMDIAARNEHLHAAIVNNVEHCRGEGRTQLVLSDRKIQLETLYKTLDGASLVTGDVPNEERYDSLYKGNVVCASTNLATEGLDRADFDTLHIALPWAGAVRFVQGIGRILRNARDKLQPRVYAYNPVGLPLLSGSFRSFRRHVRKHHYTYREEEWT